MDRTRVGVCIPGAGRGLRMGGERKSFLSLHGEPLLLHALRPFLARPDVRRVAVSLAPEDVHSVPDWLAHLDARIRIVEGGETRTHSVRAALAALGPEVDVVLVHDAARPLVTGAMIDRCLDAVRPGIGAVAGWPVVDTLKTVDEDGFVTSTPDRSTLWRAQTPQAFSYDELVVAYDRALTDGLSATDDAEIFAAAGGGIRMLEGGPWNLKVTHPEDLAVAELLLATPAGPDR